jgi:O-antigen/teichoic acid export membrane protein
MSGSLARNTILYLPAQLLGPLFQFAVTILWTHLLDPAGFGLVTFIIAAQEMTGLFGLVWWSMFVVRFQQRFSGADGVRFRAMDSRIVLLSMAVQFALVAPAIGIIGIRPSLSLFVATAAFLTTRTALNHLSEWARSSHRIGVYTVAQLVSPLVGSSLSVAAIWIWGPDPVVALGGMAIGQAIGVVAVAAGLRRRWEWGRFDPTLFAEARRYGLPLIVSGVWMWLAANGVRVIVQAHVGIAGVGLFSAGWGLGQRLSVVLAMFCTAASFPLAVERLEAGDKQGALRQVSNNGALMIALLAPAVAGVAILSRPMVQLLIAAQYREATILILPLAMATSALRMIRTHTGDQTGLLLERTSALSVFNFMDCALTLIGGGLGVYVGGVVGAAMGCLIGTALGSAAALAYSVSKLGLPVPSAAILRIMAATGLMSCALLITPAAGNLVTLLGAIAFGGSIYLIATLLLFGDIRRGLAARLQGAV